MRDISLVIMAAGMGSRFGGLKQTAQVDGRGHRLIDYSVYDGVRAGFRRLIFIIGRRMEADFIEIGRTYSKKYGISVDLVFQDADSLPDGFDLPLGRERPFGTAHAVACLAGSVTEPFAIINADDFYGRSAFYKIFAFLSDPDIKENTYSMVGYRLENTLSKNGSVSRGVCRITDGYVSEICEMQSVHREGNDIVSEGIGGRITLSPDAVVSVNLWGFTQDIINECSSRFVPFLKENLLKNPQKCEFYLPEVVSALIREGRATVRAFMSDDEWLGMTYKADVSRLKRMLFKYVKSGVYPPDL